MGLRRLLAFAFLALWFSPAGAFCLAEVAYEYVMRGEDPAPAQTLPGYAASPLAAAAEKHRPLEVRVPPVGAAGPPASFHAVEHVANLPAVLLPWRPYCARSSRLLR